ncbi:MAG: thioredoxin family protein [Acidobacteriota bacterium]
MSNLRLLLFASLAALLAVETAAQMPLFPQKAELELFADRASYAPGDEVWLAAMVEIDDHWHVNSHTPSEDYLIPTELMLKTPPGVEVVEVEYPPHAMVKFPYAERPIAVYEGEVRILAQLRLPPDAVFGELPIAATLGYQACDDSQCLPPNEIETTLALPIGATGIATHAELFLDPIVPEDVEAAVATTGAAPGASTSLPLILLFGVLGGLILNAMPCVLPVLSLKVFSLVQSAAHGRRHVVAGGLATAAGILVSFWALALAAVAAASAGAAVGWGIQFQQPGFVTFLAVIVLLFSLNMWGLFEIPLPGSLARLGGTRREGLGGHFLSGLFATLMATPCSAPFLGTAVGFALAQTAATVFLVFTAIGIGLALPYLALAAFPAAARLLPKPGGWMVAFRQVLGFCLAAAAVWLFYVLAGQIASARLAFIQLALLALALFVWWFGAAAHRLGQRRVALGGALAAAILAVGLATAAPIDARDGSLASRLHDWIPFDEAEALRLAEEGRPVFIDFTADWCLTCKATERAVIETDVVASAFAEHDVVAMKGDWTNRDDAITDYLARHGRSAVPFYVLYRPGSSDPHVFGELLTRDGLISAVRAARGEHLAAVDSR